MFWTVEPEPVFDLLVAAVVLFTVQKEQETVLELAARLNCAVGTVQNRSSYRQINRQIGLTHIRLDYPEPLCSSPQLHNL